MKIDTGVYQTGLYSDDWKSQIDTLQSQINGYADQIGKYNLWQKINSNAAAAHDNALNSKISNLQNQIQMIRENHASETKVEDMSAAGYAPQLAFSSSGAPVGSPASVGSQRSVGSSLDLISPLLSLVSTVAGLRKDSAETEQIKEQTKSIEIENQHKEEKEALLVENEKLNNARISLDNALNKLGLNYKEQELQYNLDLLKNAVAKSSQDLDLGAQEIERNIVEIVNLKWDTQLKSQVSEQNAEQLKILQSEVVQALCKATLLENDVTEDSPQFDKVMNYVTSVLGAVSTLKHIFN